MGSPNARDDRGSLVEVVSLRRVDRDENFMVAEGLARGALQRLTEECEAADGRDADRCSDVALHGSKLLTTEVSASVTIANGG